VNVSEFTQETGFEILGLEFSPIKGPEGNIEYLMYAEKREDVIKKDFTEVIESLVAKSHLEAK